MSLSLPDFKCPNVICCLYLAARKARFFSLTISLTAQFDLSIARPKNAGGLGPFR